MLNRSFLHTNSGTETFCGHRWRFAWNDARYRSTAASFHQRRELARTVPLLHFFHISSGSDL